MARPSAPAPAPPKATKAAAKAAEADPLPPFAPFLPLILAGLRYRRIHPLEWTVLLVDTEPAIPAIEFHTKIQGVSQASGTPHWSVNHQAPGNIRIAPGFAFRLNSAGRTELPVVPLSVDALPKIETPPPAQPVSDPPLAELVGVLATGPTPGQVVCARTEPAPAFAKQALRWIPVRGEQDAAPAPEAGLLPVTTKTIASAWSMRPMGASPLTLATNGAVELLKRGSESTARCATLEPSHADSACPLPVGTPVNGKSSGVRPVAPGSEWRHQSGTLPHAGSGIAAAAVRSAAGAHRIDAPAAVLPERRLLAGSAPVATVTEESSLPAAGLRSDEFDFWTWLEVLTAPQPAQETEPAPEAILALAVPRAVSVKTTTWSKVLPVEFAYAVHCRSLEVAADPQAFWAILDRATRPAWAEEERAPVRIVPAVVEEEVAGEPEPPLFTRLTPILAWRLCEPPAVQIRTGRSYHEQDWTSAVESVPKLPEPGLRPDNAESAAGDYAPPKQKSAKAAFSLKGRFQLPSSWKVWQHAPADLKWVAVGLPLILAIVLYSFKGSLPKEQAGVKLASSQSQSILGTQFASIQKVIMQRAAIHLLDDFRSGLSAWDGKPGWAKSWKYGQATFLEPGQLAVYKPTLVMKDYTLEFLGQIERQGMSWVVRADDTLRNYHVIRLVVTRPGPLPEAAIVRYTVIDGKEGPATTLPMPFPIKLSTMYRVRVEVLGKEITTYLQGQVVDSFTDTRLRAGGVGFFAPKGERALLRWVEVTHQYDYLGRFCALLAPYDVQAGAERAD